MISVSFHSEQVFYDPFHGPLYFKRKVPCSTLPLGLFQHTVKLTLRDCWRQGDMGIFLINFSGSSTSANPTGLSLCKTNVSIIIHYVQASYCKLHSLWIIRINRHLLLEGACFRIFCHYIVQRLDTDADDATELVLDHTENIQKTQAH